MTKAQTEVLCSIAGCTKFAWTRGWCRAHYQRWWEKGDPLAPVRYERGDLSSRFWRKVDKRDNCWLWTGHRNPSGYGTIGAGGARGTLLLAHRVSYELNNGPIPVGLQVCHHCDTPPCVRPDHLFVGTLKDNMRDMANKGRSVYQRHPEKAPRGERSGAAKLTTAAVIEIRQVLTLTAKSRAELASRFGVSEGTIEQVVYRRHWRHLLEVS